jgi:hypothetical protein
LARGIALVSDLCYSWSGLAACDISGMGDIRVRAGVGIRVRVRVRVSAHLLRGGKRLGL